MMKKLLSIIAVGVLAVGMLAGCGSSGGADAGGSAGAEAASAGAEAAADDQIVIGYSTVSLQMEFCANMEQAVQDACAQRGYEVVVLDCGTDGALQVSQCEDLINQGVDCLVVFPFAPEACAEIYDQASAAGIPLVCLESEIDNYDAAVITDLYAVGEAQANKAIELVGDDIKPVVLQGPTAQKTMIALKDGVVETLQANGIEPVDVQIGNNLIDESQQVVENWISSGLDFNCVIASSDGSAAGAINALKDADMLDEVTVVSENGDTIGLELIQAGDLACTVNVPSKRYGYEGIAVVEQILNGEDFEKLTFLSIDWIDETNVAEYIEAK